MTISLEAAIAEGKRILDEAGVANAGRESASILAHAIGRDRTFVITHAKEPLEPNTLEIFRKLIERRAAGEPFQYISGHQEFFKLDFEVTPNVLIPRPETELLVEISLGLLMDQPEPLFADIGTGSGCIAISLLHELPRARAIATDISTVALNLARRNAERHSVADRLKFIESDLFVALPRDQEFSLVVSNPPYIREGEWLTLQREVRDYEPRTALVSGPDGLSTIRRLLREVPAFVRSEGYFVFEIGFGQDEPVTELIDTQTWKRLEIRTDLQNIPRAVVLKRN